MYKWTGVVYEVVAGKLSARTVQKTIIIGGNAQ